MPHQRSKDPAKRRQRDDTPELMSHRNDLPTLRRREDKREHVQLPEYEARDREGLAKVSLQHGWSEH
jgi:hypothetical protein